MSNSATGVDPSILELYKLAVEMADRVSSRRTAANSFFLTVNTALVTVVGIFTADLSGRAPSPGISASASVLASALAGIVLSATWFLLLRSYRDLNSAKFAVINQIEKDHLPIRPFADEWKCLKEDPVRSWRNRYAELGFVERAVPATFGALYVGLLIVTVLG